VRYEKYLPHYWIYICCNGPSDYSTAMLYLSQLHESTKKVFSHLLERNHLPCRVPCAGLLRGPYILEYRCRSTFFYPVDKNKILNKLHVTGNETQKHFPNCGTRKKTLRIANTQGCTSDPGLFVFWRHNMFLQRNACWRLFHGLPCSYSPKTFNVKYVSALLLALLNWHSVIPKIYPLGILGELNVSRIF
jgi:hypothetical protein